MTVRPTVESVQHTVPMYGEVKTLRMTRREMADWLALRGVQRDSADMAEFLDQYEGKTEDEMDEIYDRLHG